MTQKYSLKITETEGSWSAQILRRKTARETLVTKSQEGFATESEAQAWGEQQLQAFQQLQAERNKRQQR